MPISDPAQISELKTTSQISKDGRVNVPQKFKKIYSYGRFVTFVAENGRKMTFAPQALIITN